MVEDKVSDKLTEIETPQWMLDLFKAIDSLDMSAASGINILDQNIVMQFGPKTVHGLEDVKKFFVKLDEHFITKHLVARVFRFGDAYLMQGSAELRKKSDPSGPTISAAPLFNLLWFNEKGKVMRYVVDFPPQAAAQSDAFD
jgi:hypothetical protein